MHSGAWAKVELSRSEMGIPTAKRLFLTQSAEIDLKEPPNEIACGLRRAQRDARSSPNTAHAVPAAVIGLRSLAFTLEVIGQEPPSR
jgi:hypothetical protein